jgi:hypothetical protein
MGVWISVAVAAVVVGYPQGRFLQPRTCVDTIKIHLDGNLGYQRTDPETATRSVGKAVVWEVVIDSADPRDADVGIEFKGNASPFKEKKVKSGKGNSFFGRSAKNKGDFRYSITVDGKPVVDPATQIRG